ncbi:MAG: NAD(P)/FAD-dependent oxidoreductase [Halanaerobiales bacterium]
MGAGLSGLSCAITLEQNGIEPFIFEKSSETGDRFVNCEILLSALSQPIKNSIRYFSENHNIDLKVQSNIKKLIIHSPNNTAVISGRLGHTNLRGRIKNSFEKQLQEQIKSKIKFNSKKTYEELLHEYSHVVLATGDAAYADKISNYDIELTVKLKGANIKGNFDINTVHAWLNNDLAPQGYCYLIPISNKKANIVIAYPEYPQNENTDSNKLWDRFMKEVAKTQDTAHPSFKIYDQFEISKYIIGICKYPRIGNTFLVGNNFGSIMPFLGFGQVTALLTGIYAAQDISGEGDYNKLCQPLKTSFHDSLTLRKTMEKLSNDNFDIFIKSLKGRIGRSIFTGNINYLKAISKLLQPFV